MKKNISDIRSIPDICYDPSKFKYFTEEWNGDALDVLKATEEGVEISDYASDRLFVVLRPEWMEEKILLKFTVWCMRKVSPILKSVPASNIEALDKAEQYTNGEVSYGEFMGAWNNSHYPKWKPSLTWLAAREANKVVSWEEELYKLIEILESE
jgi:hypothetical protein